KEELLSLDYQVYDCGTNSTASCDYPLIAQNLCAEMQKNPDSLGVLVCGTGIGMSMVANRQAHIRAAICTHEWQARFSREYYKANVLCLGSRMTGVELAKIILKQFLNTKFDQKNEALVKKIKAV
ncbi:MAG: RpiB/LacA/LacB family sugar-phosphate isomerase, partial [Desulfovibrionaceae bacterium]|nr:RpiB/LacA/LacB family sugar-phosphate isomerase [Desulfovibrionaceae bacterium]